MQRKKNNWGLTVDKFLSNFWERNVFRDAYYLTLDNIFLFIGVILMASSFLNFDHDRYCDGTFADHYACVNSATFYEYSTATIFVFVLGAVFIVFWYVKRNTTIIHE
ncbi:MAG: hypothetical protein KAS07_05160 [Candidatus Pacebacteria bacterium]|nr:hypothetical protein [Candidatus Paceibacterota bacterium]